MNRSAYMNPPGKSLNCSLQPGLRLLGLLGLLLVRPVLAADPIWPSPDQIGQVFNYTIPGNPPPQIDAIAFDNENRFTINFQSLSIVNGIINPELFETEDTLNYTNDGLMVANSPVSTNGIFLLLSPGCGFNFDQNSTTTGFHSMASTFYNPGQVRANSAIDTGTNFFNLATVGKILISATNILNPGSDTVGYNGLIQLNGNNANLIRSRLTVEGQPTFFNLFGFFTFTGFLQLNAGVSSLDYGVGTDTNGDWNPSAFLLPTVATSSEFSSIQVPAPNVQSMTVSPSVPYFEQNFIGTNYIITRAVFLNANPGANVSQSVFFGGNPTPYLGGGAVTIQWAGTYLDPTTGLVATNYLYLNDFYAGGASTNNNVFNGIPANFTFTELSTPATIGTAPAAPNNLPAFTLGVVTNNYSYVNVQLLGTSVSTNVSSTNPNGALTNLPGRIQITAAQEMNLALARFSGANYMALTCTNQFDGSPGAIISSPYSDYNLGVTNGFMSVSNVLLPSLPKWSGTIQAWSSDWVTVSGGITNDFRVILVNPNLVPTTAPIVQNLVLHSTNLLVSDVFNVIGKLSIDATALTLTTNLGTGGFGSQDGELNFDNPALLNTTQFPNLLWVTNNGAIRAQNLAVFGTSSKMYGAFINNSLIADQGTTICASNFLSTGTISNGTGAFVLRSQVAVLTNSIQTNTASTVIAGGNISISTGSLLTGWLDLSAGNALNLIITNQITDAGSTNGYNVWSLGSQALSAINGSYLQNGFNLPLFPTNPGDLRTTIVTNMAPANSLINNLWSAQDRGAVSSGYTNNVAIGKLVFDSFGAGPFTQFYFSGTSTNASVTNAIYVDEIELRDFAAVRDGNGDASAFGFNTNVVIYYAQIIANGISLAEKLNHHNGNHLRWVPSYAGIFSSTNLVYPAGVTNAVNAALAQSQSLDSDGDGTPNGSDPSPIFVPGQVNFTLTLTNLPPLKVLLGWDSIPGATNSVLYNTNLLSPSWQVLTNFVSPATVPPPTGWPLTNSVFDTIGPVPKYYRVIVNPNQTTFGGS